MADPSLKIAQAFVFYTTSIMTKNVFGAIIGGRKNRALGPERKGNAADKYKQLYYNKSPA